MGRDRKPQHGASNFSASSSALNIGRQSQSSLPDDASDSPRKFLKPLTRALITHPGQDHHDESLLEPIESLKNPLEWKARTINRTATWRLDIAETRDFSTEKHNSFNDPSQRRGKNDEGPFKDAIPDEVKIKMRNDAIERLADVAKKRFGNTTNMMKAFKKRSGDSISFYEFSENLRRRAMDSDFPESDLNLIFEEFDKKNEGVVQVDAIIAKSSPLSDLIDKDTAEEMLQIRAYLAQQLSKTTSSITDTDDSNSNSNTLLLPNPNKEALKQAIGQHTFDIDVNQNDLNNVIKNIFHKHHTVEAHNKFARFLRFTNVNIERIPFYPMRSEQLERLKATAEGLEKQCEDEAFTTKYKEVQSRYHAQLEQPALTSLLLTTPPSPIKVKPLLTTSQYKNKNNSLSNLSISSSSSNPSNMNSNSNFEPYFIDKCESFAHDFTFPDSPTKILQNQGSGIFDTVVVHASTSASATSGMHTYGKSQSMPELSLSNIKIGGPGPSDDSENLRLRQESMSSHYYGPLSYSSVKGEVEVARTGGGVKSDAETDASKRQYRRKARYERTQSNKQTALDRIEYNEMSSHLRSLRTTQFRIEDNVRYQTAIFLNDMKCFKKLPLELMAKKPNFRLSDKMWGGSARMQDVAEERDFKSTYTADFKTTGSGGGGVSDLDVNASASSIVHH